MIKKLRLSFLHLTKSPSLKRRRIAAFIIVAHLLGITSAFDALKSVRTPQGAVAWIVSLSTFPYVAVPAYWIFGRNKFEGYVIARRKEESELRTSLGETFTLVKAAATADGRAIGLKPLEKLAKMGTVSGNNAELLIDGEATFNSLFVGIEAAQDYVLVQFYIVRDDQIGRELQALLMRKAREGVHVYFLYDEIGSHRLRRPPRRFLSELTEAGVQVRPFYSTQGWGNWMQLNFRNHRKITVVDGQYGWVGGLNLSDEYLSRNPRFGHWRDTHMKIEGPAVLGLQLTFLEDWHWSTGHVLSLDWESHLAEKNIPILILPSGPADHFETASLMIQHVIHTARKRVWIVSPYFVPDEGVIAALKLAALRGVDIRIMIPENPDILLVKYAAYAFLEPLLYAGVKVYRYQKGFLHGKVFLIDDHLAGIGTVNLDNRSFRLNFEVTALIADTTFAEKVGDMLIEDFTHSRAMTISEIQSKSFWFRTLSRAAFLMAPLL